MRLGPVALILLLAAGCSDDLPSGPAELVASLVGHQALGGLWGLSGLDLAADGEGITLLLDSGLLVRGTLHRDELGRPTALKHWTLVPIAAPQGIDLGTRGIDSEGLAASEAGTFVSLERIHEVWRLNPAGEVEERLPRHPDFADLWSNGSLEALAIDDAGTLYTLAERSGWWRQPFPVWRHAGGAWERAFMLPRRGGFLPVGADFGPDGRLYVLERRMPLPLRFATRVRRFTLDDSGLAAEETLLETPPGLHDNLEGLAVWQDDTGAIRLTMVSDDNRSRFQETQIVEYRLPPELAAGAAER